MNEHKQNAELVAKYGRPGTGHWMVVLTLSGGETREMFPSREQAEAAAARARRIGPAFVHYCY
jgi:hypothetical protein